MEAPAAECFSSLVGKLKHYRNLWGTELSKNSGKQVKNERKIKDFFLTTLNVPGVSETFSDLMPIMQRSTTKFQSTFFLTLFSIIQVYVILHFRHDQGSTVLEDMSLPLLRTDSLDYCLTLFNLSL